MMKKNDLVTLTIDGYTAEGMGVGRADGMAVFVPGTIAGERAQVQLLKVKKTFAYAKPLRIETASPARIVPDCPVYPRCGGCALRHMTYAEELAMKRQRVDDALRRIGALTLTVDDILPAEGDGFARRKVIFNVGEQAGRPVAGFYRARSHDIVPAPDCPANACTCP